MSDAVCTVEGQNFEYEYEMDDQDEEKLSLEIDQELEEEFFALRKKWMGSAGSNFNMKQLARRLAPFRLD